MTLVAVAGVAAASDGFAVLLSGDSKVLPVFVGPDQAQSIQMALTGQVFPRPLTHDLFVEVVNEMGGAFDRLLIDDLNEGTYYGKLYVEVYDGENSRETVFDVRPSDGIALISRVGGSIEVDAELLEENGIDEDQLDAFD
ncbi:MAG: hypothetical protein MAG715_00188 [Methanonatronarchaeales archaeon]|nr:hypothetical protein [Methanonatronarchaeales archaeon]